MYGGRSFSLGLSSSPIRRLTIAMSYVHANADMQSNSFSSLNFTEQFNTLFQYQFRKVALTGGYSRLEQGFSTSGVPPANFSAFYIGLSRWFNLF
jgi:hypothetical protein